ncbi:MAG: sugar kinase [Pseudomonadota bacterium]
MATVSVFGEPLLELACQKAGAVLGPSVLGIAGDTLNTAVYLSRLGHEVSFVTAVGVDAYSDALLERLAGEGVSVKFIGRHESRTLGLYAIRTDADGERYFVYWRDSSAARAFFELSDACTLIESVLDSDLFYFSGISLAILSPDGRERLLDVAGRCAGLVAFDGNYRPYGWQGVDDARHYLEAVGGVASIVMPTSEDDDALFGSATPVEHARRWCSYGVDTAVVKNGPDGAWLLNSSGVPLHTEVEKVIQPVDTTGAGDSFNAGFLSARLDGESLRDAAQAGNRLAARVICERGALIPRSRMP